MDCPSPGISIIAWAAWCKTASGRAAGPALKRMLRMGFFGFFLVVIAGNTATYGHFHGIGGVHIERYNVFLINNHQHTAHGVGMGQVNGHFAFEFEFAEFFLGFEANLKDFGLGANFNENGFIEFSFFAHEAFHYIFYRGINEFDEGRAFEEVIEEVDEEF